MQLGTAVWYFGIYVHVTLLFYLVTYHTYVLYLEDPRSEHCAQDPRNTTSFEHIRKIRGGFDGMLGESHKESKVCYLFLSAKYRPSL